MTARLRADRSRGCVRIIEDGRSCSFAEKIFFPRKIPAVSQEGKSETEKEKCFHCRSRRSASRWKGSEINNIVARTLERWKESHGTKDTFYWTLNSSGAIRFISVKRRMKMFRCGTAAKNVCGFVKCMNKNEI